MFVAELIDPEEVAGKISCKNCSLSYSKEHYNILQENKKLGYFKITDIYYEINAVFDQSCTCHSCLFKLFKHIADSQLDGTVKIKLIYKNKDFFLSYDKEDPSSLW